MGALDAATGKLLWRKYTIPAPGEPGSETWKDKTNAWQTGGGAVWVTGTYPNFPNWRSDFGILSAKAESLQGAKRRKRV
jgi:hypothetical protein